MNRVVRIANGAYFVPSYSDQTITSHQPGIVTQCGVTMINQGERDQIGFIQQDAPNVDELIDEILVDRAPAWKELAKH